MKELTGEEIQWFESFTKKHTVLKTLLTKMLCYFFISLLLIINHSYSRILSLKDKFSFFL